MADRLARDGARVAVVDIDPGDAGTGPGGGDTDTGATGAAPGEGAVVAVLRADVADAGAMTAAVEEAAEALGGLSILVNNAGFGTAKPSTATPTTSGPAWSASTSPACGTASGPQLPRLRAATAGGVAASIVNIAGTTASRPTRGRGPLRGGQGRGGGPHPDGRPRARRRCGSTRCRPATSPPA